MTWLWTVNLIHTQRSVPSPGTWWPGRSYVTWVGIDGYYYSSSSTFVSLFGPTIAAVRALTSAPILIAETAAAPSTGQSSKSPTCSLPFVPTTFGFGGSTPITSRTGGSRLLRRSLLSVVEPRPTTCPTYSRGLVSYAPASLTNSKELAVLFQ